MKKIIYSGLLFSVLITGCTNHYLDGFNPQSHFDYPNSNVIPVGQVKGEASVVRIGMAPPFPTGALKKEAVNNALAKKSDADILINYTSSIDVTSMLIFNVLTYKVEGTAAKMDIGKQKIMGVE